MRDIKDLRKQINDIDTKMAKLFEERMKVAKDVAEYKLQKGLNILDESREAQVIHNGLSQIKDPNIQEYYTNFIKNNMQLSKDYQRRVFRGLKVAYSGAEGAFAHIAASEIYPDAKKISYHGFKAAYEAVEQGKCDVAVLPVENSFAGDVDQVNDIMFNGSLFLNGMYDLAVVHDVLGVKGATMNDIKTLVSHPQALSQCSKFINDNKFKTMEYSNTALAAEYVKEKNDKSFAAIASAKSARMFGLDVLYHGINDDRTNTTRFACFSRAQNKNSENKKELYFSLVFTAKNEAGSLAKALDIIGKYGYNMRTLRSRPMKSLMWQYYFYVEAQGDIYSTKGKSCLRELKECCDKIKVIGSYHNIKGNA